MLGRLKEIWRDFRRSRRMARELDPATFLRLSEEISQLAETASKLWLEDPRFHQRLKRVQAEMNQLQDLAAKPEFKRLSPQKRLELRKNLILSRRQLLKSMHKAPPPTGTLQ